MIHTVYWNVYIQFINTVLVHLFHVEGDFPSKISGHPSTCIQYEIFVSFSIDLCVFVTSRFILLTVWVASVVIGLNFNF